MSAIDTDLVIACEHHGKLIDQHNITHDGQRVNGARLLLTLAGIESNFGKLKDFVRFEKGYAPGGKYYNESPDLRAQFRKWGCLACSSYGSFQIMYMTARELGFTDHPITLQEDNVCAHWATQLIVKRFIVRHQAKTLKEILDGYNSGYHKDQYIPSLYIEKGIQFYQDLPGIV